MKRFLRPALLVLVLAAAGVAWSYLSRGGAALDLVALPGGTFATARGEIVTVAPFSLGRTEVTVDQYAVCAAQKKCAPAPSRSPQCNGSHATRGVHPVNCVTWHEAAAYCAFRGGRLPSEDEWEWAARGAEAGTSYPWGTEPPEGRACWALVEPEGSSCPAHEPAAGASPQGIVGLAGNVWEWTSSPGGSTEGGGIYWFRGGGFKTVRPDHLGSGGRDRFPADGRSEVVGFRCAR